MRRAEVDWVEWFGASADEARHFERVRQAMWGSGLRTDPETVIEVARYILNTSGASSRLRKLADVWEEGIDEHLGLVANG